MSEPMNPPELHENVLAFEPRPGPAQRLARRSYDVLASARLAMALLVLILVCCVTGVTVYRGDRAGEVIFDTLWFNGLLVLLVVNVACCFFGRIWGRRVTLVSFGMILFHLSFVAVFAGVVWNSLFFFKGSIRLTEGETLPSGDPRSYDTVERGRFFDFGTLRGETTLHRMHTGYRVGGNDKRAAYDVSVGEPGAQTRGVVYVTRNLDHGGFKYLPEKEGYSTLVVLSDARGREIYGAYVPLQSFTRDGGGHWYATGTREGPGILAFPQPPLPPSFNLNVEYLPDPRRERGGEVRLRVWPLAAPGGGARGRPAVEGKTAVGGTFDGGRYRLSPREVRYWVGMTVRRDPGKPLVLGSLCSGLAGMVLTTVGRVARGRKSRARPGGAPADGGGWAPVAQSEEEEVA